MVAALLHDVLDDTDADLAEIQELFGEQVGVRYARCACCACDLCELCKVRQPAAACSRQPCGALLSADAVCALRTVLTCIALAVPCRAVVCRWLAW